MANHVTFPPGAGRWHSRGYLPHFDQSELAQFVTCRLADSLPTHVLERWRADLPNLDSIQGQILLHNRIEKYLDQGFEREHLKKQSLAMMVQNSMLNFS